MIPTEADAAGRLITVPVLPLVDSVVFPGSIYPLSLQGVQSAQLVGAALELGGFVGLFLQKEPAGAEPHLDNTYRVGTLARLEDIHEADDGSIVATAVGLHRAKLQSVCSWDPFVLAELEVLEEKEVEEPGAAQLFGQVSDLYRALLTTSPDAAATLLPVLDQTTRPADLSYLVAATVPISPAARQTILELDGAGHKLLQLVPLLARAHELSAREQLASPATASANAATRTPMKPVPPTGARSTSGQEQVTLDHLELQQRLLNAGLPPEARRVAERELERLASLSPASPDYNMVRTYLQWLSDLPWTDDAEPEIDLERARTLLDRDHYGLDEVKERILEYLAVRKLRGERRNAAHEAEIGYPGDPVLCLLGPPGIGKTSLGRSVAEALGRPFVRLSLGGVTDEADIRGHRRTYLGAMPGKIVQGIARQSSRHPVIMLDELDKVGSGGKGDPASALLEVLDAEQQRTFLDHYIDVPYDLSSVFFIATANLLDTLAPALRDRLEVIQLSGYTEVEKLQIALRHIIPRQMEWHALRDADIKWDPEAVLELIRGYTREAGVRQLEREIAAICRRAATLIAREDAGPERPVVADSDFIGEVLGAARYLPDQPDTSEEPGVATGVVWTPAGGDVIHVEASIMPGRKTLTITGQLGDIMRESAQAALSYVRARAEFLGVDPQFFDSHDIHLHVPSGAVPKDGPSAGITLATALVSLLTGRAVPSDLAMTGELTLRGRVLPVGGIREKALAARRAGIRRLILPTQNRRDLDAVPAELSEALDFTFADTMDDVLASAFGPAAEQEGRASKSRKQNRTKTPLEDEAGELPRAAKRR